VKVRLAGGARLTASRACSGTASTAGTSTAVANLDPTPRSSWPARNAGDRPHCFELPAPQSVAGVITRTVDIVMRDRVQRDMAALSGRARITLLQPEVQHGPGVGDFRNVVRLLDEGIAMGERFERADNEATAYGPACPEKA
jgi:hypothetical protein